MACVITKNRPGSQLVVAVLKPDGEWYVDRNPKEKNIPEGERIDMYDTQGARLVLPKGAIKIAKSLLKDRRRNANHGA